MNSPPRPVPAVGARPAAAPATDALALARSLQNLLDQEFESLKQREIVRFETLQTEKAQLLALISAAAGPDAERLPAGVLREDFKDLIAGCRDALRRNECLVSHQLASIRGALSTLTASSQGPSVEVYDQLGKINRGRGARPYSEA
jgi:flagellar biosynthesis/type III secretory pathway chaperone